MLLCQAQPRSDLVVEARHVPALRPGFVVARLVGVTPLPLRALRVQVQFAGAELRARPGQFLDVRDPAGDIERLPVIESEGDTVSFESAADASPVRRWLDSEPPAGAVLHLAGPFDRPR